MNKVLEISDAGGNIIFQQVIAPGYENFSWSSPGGSITVDLGGVSLRDLRVEKDSKRPKDAQLGKKGK